MTVAVIGLTLRETPRVVLPVALVALVKVTVSLKEPTFKVLALALIEAVTVVLAPAARVPLVVLRSTQLAVLAAVQSMSVLPGLLSVYCSDEGVNGPPKFPDEVNPPAGVTARVPGPTPVPVREILKGFSLASLLAM